MTRDSMNLGLLPVDCSGKYDLPTVDSMGERCFATTKGERCFALTDIPDAMIPFNKAKTSRRKDVGVHFFIDDYQFERVWRSPQLYADMLKKYAFVCAPDFSMYLDMPLAMKIWNVYRSRMVASYWQRNGVRVVPTLQWAEPSTFDFCFDGIEPGGTVAVSTLGAAKHRDSRVYWANGMREAIRQLHPTTIILYGQPIAFDFGNINIVHYRNETIERMEHYGR